MPDVAGAPRRAPDGFDFARSLLPPRRDDGRRCIVRYGARRMGLISPIGSLRRDVGWRRTRAEHPNLSKSPAGAQPQRTPQLLTGRAGGGSLVSVGWMDDVGAEASDERGELRPASWGGSSWLSDTRFIRARGKQRPASGAAKPGTGINRNPFCGRKLESGVFSGLCGGDLACKTGETFPLPAAFLFGREWPGRYMIDAHPA